MGFEAHPVTKERWPDLVELFDRPIVRTCFCMFYRKTGTGTGVGLQNRQAMKALVDGGTVPGLIGYENGVPVAWVSVGPREDYAKLRRSPVMKPVDDRPVWSIMYDRAGFREVARRRPTRPVVRKALRPGSSATGP